MARYYNRLRETTFDLYVERDSLAAYFRSVILVSTWVIYIGYILFALAFSVPKHELASGQVLLVALASALLIVGYSIGAVTSFFSGSLLFLIDGALFPILTASVAGVMITALTYGVKTTGKSWGLMVVPLATSLVTTAVSILLLVLVYREVNRIKRRDERRRWHVALGPYGSDPSQAVTPHQRSSNGPEDDPQRRQLMRLLQERSDQSSMDITRGTYKIDLPGEQRANPFAWNAGSTHRSQFHVSDLLPWNTSTNGTFKDARERRREEIERSGIPPSEDSTSDSRHQRSPSRSRGHDRSKVRHPALEQPRSKSSWGWPAATRYA